jgi:sulfhydrogenase subunit beta (sulfur reductase)
MGKLLKKEDYKRFLSNLKSKYELIAPVKVGDIVKYEIINDINDICLDKQPFYSIKKFFLPRTEELFDFQERRKFGLFRRPKKRIIFGLRKCDANSLLVMDELFLEGYVDARYKERRENTILITIPCKDPEENCFCESMNLKDYFDLKFTDIGDSSYIDIGSGKGRSLVHRFKDHKMNIDSEIKCKRKLNKKELRPFFENKIWNTESEKCLGCCMCTTHCPTCTCFDIKDEVEINLKDGTRYRIEDSCQLKSFTRVAGNHIFREPRYARLRHRIFHKLQYFREKYKMDMCVGCGRCISICPTKIDMVDIVNKLK